MAKLTEDQIRLTFGLKLRQAREKKNLSLLGLSKLTGLSKSYLNEIEKGKKYPKTDKIVLLSESLGLSYEEMVSLKLTGPMTPLVNIIQSGILKEIPLELFGINPNNLIDLIANAPEKVTAFIGTFFEIARNYNITKEDFYLWALRGYQESRENYFDSIESEVQSFDQRYQLNLNQKISAKDLEEILVHEFGYQLDYSTLKENDYPEAIRSVFIPKQKKLLIANNTSETQRVFILAKELGYTHLKIKERPLTFTWIKFSQFEEVLNNFRASYFAGALILPKQTLSNDLTVFFKRKKWDSSVFLSTLLKYTDSAETFFQRLTNLLPKELGIKNLYFLRFEMKANSLPKLTKELHLSRNHQPHALQKNEHYCSRWVCTDILLSPSNYNVKDDIRVGIQISTYDNTGESYLTITASNIDPFKSNKVRSVCIGIELNTKQKKKIAFFEDKKIPQKKVGITCERCGIKDCAERKAPASISDRLKWNQEVEERVYDLINPS